MFVAPLKDSGLTAPRCRRCRRPRTATPAREAVVGVYSAATNGDNWTDEFWTWINSVAVARPDLDVAGGREEDAQPVETAIDSRRTSSNFVVSRRLPSSVPSCSPRGPRCC